MLSKNPNLTTLNIWYCDDRRNKHHTIDFKHISSLDTLLIDVDSGIILILFTFVESSEVVLAAGYLFLEKP